jgi:hypothetical protein
VDIGRLNTALDKFMKRLYDVDVYVTTSKWDDDLYDVNILFFPSKFLKRSPDYSEKYYDFFNRPESEIESDILDAFTFFNVSPKKINYFKIDVSSKNSEYFQNYINELLYNINNFIETQPIDNLDLSDRISNIRINRIDHVKPLWVEDTPPYLSLRLSHDYSDENSSVFSHISPLLNDDFVRGPMVDYLKTKMELDPQIEFWFEK